MRKVAGECLMDEFCQARLRWPRSGEPYHAFSSPRLVMFAEPPRFGFLCAVIGLPFEGWITKKGSGSGRLISSYTDQLKVYLDKIEEACRAIFDCKKGNANENVFRAVHRTAAEEDPARA